jgi:HlyD family secretion protein
VLLVVIVTGVTLASLGYLSPQLETGPEVVVRRGTLAIRLVESGVLRPRELVTYRSPLGTREVEVTFLVGEGTRVQEGDLIARLDTDELEVDQLRARQALRQAAADLQAAEADAEEAADTLESLQSGEKSLDVDEALSNVKVAEAKVDRLRREYESLQPLLAKGFVTRDEIDRAAGELEQADVTLGLARRRSTVLVGTTRPRDERRARLILSQRQARVAQCRQRVAEAAEFEKLLNLAHEACAIHARGPGLVLHEDSVFANPRRKVRVGDRVTASQGLLTVSEVTRMTVESSVREADVHLVRPGQAATVSLDAVPGVRLTGRVARVGVLAHPPIDRPFDEKRYDLLIDLDPFDADLRPEMTARIEMLVEERRNVLLLPVAAIGETDGRPTVMPARGWRRDPLPVVLGRTDDYLVEVVDGLREGDRVRLLPAAPTPTVVPVTEAAGLVRR